MRKLSISIIIVAFFLVVPLISADLDNFNLGLDYSNSGEYTKSIGLLENNCPEVSEDKYHSAQCYFVLCYDYYMLWQDSKIVVGVKNDSYFVGPKNNLFLLNKSVDNCLRTINLSWSDLTHEALLNNKESGFLISGLSFLINNYLLLGDYKNAEATLKHLESIDALNSSDQRFEETINSIYNKFYSALPKKVEIELIGDLDPLFFSEPEIKPKIILSSEEDSGFSTLHTEYINLFGKQFYDIEENKNLFIFNKKLSLNSKRSLLYPFDSYSAEIFNITPSRIKSGNIEISMIGEDSKIEGMAYFEKDKITLTLNREIRTIINIVLSFFLLIFGLIFLNKRIKFMRKASFQPKNLLSQWSFDLSLISLIYFITSNSSNIWNLLTIVIFVLIIITMIRFYKKYKRVSNEKI